MCIGMNSRGVALLMVSSSQYTPRELGDVSGNAKEWGPGSESFVRLSGSERCRNG